MPQTPDSLAWLKALLPAPLAISPREKLRASIGAALGILLAALGAAWWSQGLAAHTSPLLALVLVAPLGASAVLVFALPSSPLAQPWSVIGGNTLSALVGIACSRWVPDATVAAAMAVGLAIAVMMALRCLHPPGGAAALLMVLADASDFRIAFNPVLLDSLLMVAGALLYNNLTRRRWPHRDRAPSAEARLQQSDLDTALARYNQVLDISRDDLQALLEQAESAAYQRTMGVIRCADVMTPDPVVARADMPLQAAWALMRKHRVKALPVIDSQLHLVGIVTVADFMRQVDMDVHEGMAWRLRSLLRPKAPSGDSQVGQIMTRNVRVSSGDRLLIDLVPVFSVAGHRHIPIIDQDRRLAGIITQSDLIKALYKAVHG